MPTQKFAFERGGDKRLVISWGLAWRNFTITLDDSVLYQANVSVSQLRAGISVPLPDHAILIVQLKTSGIVTALEVTRDGIVLPGSSSDPETAVNLAATLIYILAAFNAVIGILTIVTDSPFLDQLGVSWFSLVFGVVFAALGYLVKTRRSQFALAAAILLWGADSVLALIMSVATGTNFPIGILLTRGFILYFMIQGFTALRQITSGDL